MQRLMKIIGDPRYLSAAFATFAAVYGTLTASDLNLFYSGYSAGAAGAIALLLWLEED